jgi:syntaxin 5
LRLFDTFEEQLNKLSSLIGDSGLLGNTGKLKGQLTLVKGGARTVQDNLAHVLGLLKQVGRTDASTAHHRRHLTLIADYCRSRHTRLVNRLSELLSAHQANLTAQSTARRGLAADRSTTAPGVAVGTRSIDELQTGPATDDGQTMGGTAGGGGGGGLRRRRGAGPDPALLGSSHGASTAGFVVPSAQSSSLLSRRGDSSTMAEVEATIVELGDVFRRVQSHVHEQEALITRIDQDTSDAAIRIDAAQAALSAFWHDLKNSRSLIFKLFAILLVMIVLVLVFFR